ncbi:MAG: hypothetical protein OXC11_00745 [Rhodospirillales bacterium]|nr:hypothetical protein [Rhodospirillales bacterium]
MIILDASRSGAILDCPRRAQFIHHHGQSTDPVVTAAQLVGEWAHKRWLEDANLNDWAQVTLPHNVGVIYDKVTPDKPTAIRQANEIALRAEVLLDAIARPWDRHRHCTEEPLSGEFADMMIRSRADVHWWHEGCAHIAELKTGRPRASDVSQLAMTAAPLLGQGQRLRGHLLYVPRKGGDVEARTYSGQGLAAMATGLAAAWQQWGHPVPSHLCQNCPVVECAVGRPHVTPAGRIDP